MNARHPFPEQPTTGSYAGQPAPAPFVEPASLPDAPPVRHVHRQRDFGIGYGNSSGYGSDLHYLDGHVDPLFRCG